MFFTLCVVFFLNVILIDSGRIPYEYERSRISSGYNPLLYGDHYYVDDRYPALINYKGEKKKRNECKADPCGIWNNCCHNLCGCKEGQGQCNEFNCDPLVRPRSIGRVYLNSIDPHIHPIIDTQYLTHNNDIRVITDGLRKAIILSLSKDFAKYARMLRQPIPGCQLCTDQPIWNCISYLECYARTLSNTVYHQIGTCQMGNSTDSVEDERLRVRGVERLRVIDASVFPMIPNGNTNAATIMVAEYGAQIVMNDNSKGILFCKSFYKTTAYCHILVYQYI